MLGTGVSLGLALLGGDSRLLLLRESFITGPIGVLCFVSLVLLPRPLMFYVGRQLQAGDDPIALAQYEAAWAFPTARRGYRVVTAVWSLAFVTELALRISVSCCCCPRRSCLVAGPLVLGGITLVSLSWTFADIRRRQLRREAGTNAIVSGVEVSSL